MIRRGIILFNILLYTIYLSAQDFNVIIKGDVNDNLGGKLPYSALILFNNSDTSVVKTLISNDQGQYDINIKLKNGKYTLKASHIGFYQIDESQIEIKSDTSLYIKISLQPSNNQLKEVEISAFKPFIIQQPDKITVDVENSALLKSGTALEALVKSPGVTLNRRDNQLCLMGKCNLLFLFDGRRSYLSSEDIVLKLESMPANMIASFELITNPSSKYDAEGIGGIINILFKKPEGDGQRLNLNYGLGRGEFFSHNGGVTYSLKKKKINTVFSYNIYTGKSFREYNLYRKVIQQDFETFLRSEPTSLSHTSRLVFDYEINKKNTIGFNIDNNIYKTGIIGTGFSNILEANKPDSVINQDNNLKYNGYSNSMNIYYINKYGKQDNEIQYNLNFYNYLPNTNNYYNASLMNMTGTIIPIWQLKNLEDKNIKVYSANIDWIAPKCKIGSIEAGIKNSYVTIDYNSTFDINKFGLNTIESPKFIFEENILASYLTYSKNFKKDWIIKGGLREEETFSKGESELNKNLVNSKYFNLFPSMYIMKTYKENHVFKTSYNRRINRPKYNNLNPARYYFDAYSYYIGNAELQPSYSNKLECLYSFKNTTTISFNEEFVKNNIDQIPIQNDTTKNMQYLFANLGKFNSVGLNLDIYRQKKWFEFICNINYAYNTYKNNYKDMSITSTIFAFESYIQTNYALPHDIKLETSLWFCGKANTGIYTSKSLYSVNIGLSKTFGKQKNIRLSINGNDIFKTLRNQFYAEFSNVNLHANIIEDSRSVWINLSWTIGKQDVEDKEQSESKIKSEINRIK